MKTHGSNMAVCTFAEARPGTEFGLGGSFAGMGCCQWPPSTCGNSHVLVTRQDLRLSLGVRLGQGPTVGQYFVMLQDLCLQAGGLEVSKTLNL